VRTVSTRTGKRFVFQIVTEKVTVSPALTSLGTIEVAADDGAVPPPKAGAGDGAGASATGGAPSGNGGGAASSGGGASAGGGGAPSSATVTVGDNFFEPASVTVAPGGTVTWTHEGQVPHTATAADGAFDSGIFGAGESWSQSFDEPGSYEYVCSLHPEMRGVVHVNEEEVEGDAPAGDEVAPERSSPDRASRGQGEAGPGDAEGAPESAAVSIGDSFFDPENVVVQEGGTVTWTHDGELPHTVTSEDGAFDSDIREPGEEFSWAAEEAGVYPYVCTLHPEMTGVVEVVAEGAEAGAAAGDDSADEEDAAALDGAAAAAQAPGLPLEQLLAIVGAILLAPLILLAGQRLLPDRRRAESVSQPVDAQSG
jgi:plastocyanin